MLLYSLLQYHPTFLPFLTQKGELMQELILCLLEQMHNLGSTSNAIFCGQLENKFITVINLLMIIQDASLKHLFFKMDIPHQAAYSWYPDKNKHRLTVGDLIVLCVIKCMTHTLFQLKNSYLLSNCLAILLNIAPHVLNLHTHTAERLVKVILAFMSIILIVIFIFRCLFI